MFAEENGGAGLPIQPHEETNHNLQVNQNRIVIDVSGRGTKPGTRKPHDNPWTEATKGIKSSTCLKISLHKATLGALEWKSSYEKG